MSDMLDADVIEAAGGIVEQKTDGGVRIAVVHRTRYGSEWALPKGKRQSSETWQEAALREVREETGLGPSIVAFAGATSYVHGQAAKVVLYWRMRVDPSAAAFAKNEEVDQLAWLTPGDAVRRLTHKEQADLVASLYPRGEAMTGSGVALWRVRLIRLTQSTRWRRVASEISAYQEELEGRAARSQTLSITLPAIHAALEHAREALKHGCIDQAWRLFHAARRLELLGLEGEALTAAAVGIREEAEKLGSWRRRAVESLLKSKEGKEPTVARVFRAAVLRDEHYDNESYKDALRRGHAVRMALVLVAIVIAILLLAWRGILPSDGWTIGPGGEIDLFKALVSVVVLGLLGATVSAVVAAPDPRASTRIPETASTVRVTVLRLFMGPAAAILIYLVANSKLSKTIFRFDAADPFTMLVIAFVAGFSERLVLRVVQAIAGGAEGSGKT